MTPMLGQVGERYGKTPGTYAVDSGFATKEEITAVERRGAQVLAPIHAEESLRNKGKDPHARQRGDTDEMVVFRQRMGTDEAKRRYQQRPSIAEFPNAEFRNRGLSRFRVRGLRKARAVALWHALTFNFMRMVQLGCVT